MTRTQDFTQGKTSSLILKFFFPMLMTNMLQQLYSVADTATVGKGLGDSALAAVGNMSSLCFLITGFSLGLANGFAVSIAQRFGAKKDRELKQSIASSIVLSGIIAVVLTLLSVVFLKDILTLIRTDSAIMGDSLAYGYVLFGGLTATIAYNLCSSILRALGDSKTPFIAIITSTILNITLNCVFIFGLGTGVAGAAVATIIAQVVSVAICFIRLRKIEAIRLTREDFRLCLSMYRELMGNGLPMALMNSITAVGCMVVQFFVNGMGVAYTSAYSACSKFINLFMMPACTAGYTLSAFTSQNYGACRFDRIREGVRVCVGIAVISYVVLGGVMVLFPRAIASVMLTGEEPIRLTMQFLPLCGAMIFGVDLLFIFRSAVQGMARPLVPMVSGIVEMLMRILVIVAGMDVLGFRATAYAEIVAWLGALALNLSAYCVIMSKHREKRKRLAFCNE